MPYCYLATLVGGLFLALACSSSTLILSSIWRLLSSSCSVLRLTSSSVVDLSLTLSDDSAAESYIRQRRREIITNTVKVKSFTHLTIVYS
mgnify:CR=1 FL=1